MEELKFTDGGDLLELTVEPEKNQKLLSYRDARVGVRIKSAGFSAQNDVWVHVDALREFCRRLVALEESRKGVAILRSLSPGELDLSVRSVSGVGAMSVTGSCAYSVPRPHGAILHRLEFGFEFDPSQLISAAAIAWVQSYAA